MRREVYLKDQQWQANSISTKTFCDKTVGFYHTKVFTVIGGKFDKKNM